MASSTTRIKDLLDKTKHYDADERFMAVHDLVTQLKGIPGPLEQSVQVPIRDTILRLLDDGSSDVSTVAVKCLSELVTKLAADQVVYISDRLGALIANPAIIGTQSTVSSSDGNGDDRRGSSLDIVADALQTLITNASIENGKAVAPKLIKSLLAGLGQPVSKEIDGTMACLTLLKQILEKFGNDVTETHEAIMATIIKLLEHPADAVKKRASVTLAPLVTVLNDTLFNSLMATLIKAMTEKKNPEIYIQSVSAISRAAGVRVGAYLPNIVPKLTSFLKLSQAEKESEEPEERRIEMLETCLQAIYAIILRCPTKVTPYVHDLVNAAIELSQWDPLYTYDDERDESGMKKSKNTDESMETEEWGGDGGEDGWGDDAGGDDDGAVAWGGEEEAGGISAGSNDTSWKVRRAAFGVLAAFIKARSDLLKDYYNLLCDHLVARMKEHDSAVKEELMLATRDLLHESVVADRASTVLDSQANSAIVTDDELPSMQPIYTRTRSTYATLDSKIPSIIRSVEREFSSSDIRTQKTIFAVLQELFQVKHGQLAPYFDLLIPHIIDGIKGTGRLAEINDDALSVMNLILKSHPFEPLESHLKPVTAATIKSIETGLPKNIPLSLSVLTSIAKLSKQSQSLRESIARDMFRVVFAQLDQRDVPLDVKLASISTMAVLIASAASQLGGDVGRVWPVLAERMSNDTTCQPALKAITKMAHSDQQVDCSPMIAHTAEMIIFIRKSSPLLKQDTVKCLESLMRAHPTAFDQSHIALILREVTVYIDESDFQLAHLVLDLINTILVKTSNQSLVVGTVSGEITKNAIQLTCSSLLQSSTLSSLRTFYTLLVTSRPVQQQSQAYQSLFNQLQSCVTPSLNKTAFHAIAKSLATVSMCASADNRRVSITSAINAVQVTTPNAVQLATALVSLLYLGELARLTDMAEIPNIETVCVRAFDHSDDNVRSAAAFTLGSLSIGSPNQFLPSLLTLIGNNPQQQFLLFTALKEIILHYSNHSQSLKSVFQPSVPVILSLLLSNINSPDESTRAMVSECLGRITVIDPSLLLTNLEKLAQDKNPLARVGVITAVRFAFSPNMDYEALAHHLKSFVVLIQDSDLEVQRQSILTIDALFRAHPESVPRELIASLLVPALIQLSKPRPELIREVDYGAFKQKVDDGKPVRKATYQCVDTLIQRAAHRIDLSDIIKALVAGVSDSDESIQTSVYNTFYHLAVNHPSQLLEQVDLLPKSMMTPVKAHLAAIKNAKDNEAAMDCLRACVRALLAINQIPGIELATNYTHFFKQVCATAAMAQLIKEMQQK